MKTSPLTKPRPTNADIVEQLNAVHHCLDDHRTEVARALKAQSKRIDKVDEKVDNVIGKVDHMGVRLGTSNEAPPTMATMNPRKAFFGTMAATGGSVAGVFMLLKVAALAAPFALGLAMALWKMITA